MTLVPHGVKLFCDVKESVALEVDEVAAISQMHCGCLCIQCNAQGSSTIYTRCSKYPHPLTPLILIQAYKKVSVSEEVFSPLMKTEGGLNTVCLDSIHSWIVY